MTRLQDISGPDRERNPLIQSDNSGKRLRRLAAVVTAGTVVFLGASNLDKVGDVLHEGFTERSDIVPGVPGQVEGHRYTPRKFNAATKTWDKPEYHLIIEQSPIAVADVLEDGVLDGGARIHPDIGVIIDGNAYDFVKVGRGTYESSPAGSMITFAGDPHGHGHTHK